MNTVADRQIQQQQVVTPQQIAEFPIVKPATGEIGWYKIQDKKLLVARQPQGLKNPKIAELAINMTQERDQFKATLYMVDGNVSEISGDEVSDRIAKAISVASWAWYFESDPITVIDDNVSPQIISSMILWCKVQCANCKRIILPHQCKISLDGKKFLGECAACSKK